MAKLEVAAFTIFFVLLISVEVSFCRWWNLAVSNEEDDCNKLDILGDRQKELCSLSPKILNTVANGAKIGIEECQHQFRNSRWNCSTTTSPNSTDIFGEVLSVDSREAAFVYAVSSASVAWAVTRACSKGELNECLCDNRVRMKGQKNWQWKGCSEDIQYGERFSKEFLDSIENRDTPTGVMNLHNNEAGRRAIKSKMQRVCKCHGMSGSCSVRVCWRKLPHFRFIGDVLNQRYEGASHVKVVERKRLKKTKKLRPYHPDIKKPNKTDLVYLDESPDYCEQNEQMGILGTHGRLCDRKSAGPDGCRLLCCGRGYQTRIKEVEEKCKCRFIWCCNVVCETCRFKREEHVCN